MNEEHERIPNGAFRQKRSDDFLREIMRPDLYREGQHMLTKELKLSNIKREDLEDGVEVTDIAWQWEKLTGGINAFSDFLVMIRDTKLSLTSSICGFERAMAATDIQEHKLREERKGTLSAIFRRGGDENAR